MIVERKMDNLSGCRWCWWCGWGGCGRERAMEREKEERERRRKEGGLLGYSLDGDRPRGHCALDNFSCRIKI
jgi:hypothetical protein